MTHASEQGHWYRRDGTPCYTVKAKDGSDRPATLADARKLGLCPGVTSILNCAAKPGLERWKQQQVLLAALTLERKPNEPEYLYLARILDDSAEQARKAAARGTSIHAAIQGHYEGTPPDPEYWPFVSSVVAQLDSRYGKQPWIAERSFASPLGYGGKIDLHCDSILLDVKTKEFEEPIKKLAWDEHAMQLAAYDAGLSAGAWKTCANVFVSTKVPGLIHIHEWDVEELDRAWWKFQALLAYWQWDRNYKCGWEKEAA